MVDINFSQQELHEIKEALPKGALSDIARELNIDRSTVTRVFNKDFKNDAIIELALAKIEKRVNLKQRFQTLKGNE